MEKHPRGGVTLPAYISHFIAVNPFFLLEQEVFGLFNICVVLTGKELVEYSQNITNRQKFKKVKQVIESRMFAFKDEYRGIFPF